MKTVPLVSIKCTVFNHEPFLRQCLDGFVMQKTSFPYEAIVHDDASTDASAAIIREYAERYPDIIKPIYETENQYSKNDILIRVIMDDAVNVDTKYIAICEGDDYWTDPHKLQRQVDFLETHTDYVAVAENSVVHNIIDNSTRLFSNKEERNLTLEEIITQRQFATASVVYKKEIMATESYLQMKYRLDTFLWCCSVNIGLFRYQNHVSSVYNRGIGVTETTEPYIWGGKVREWNAELQTLYEHILGKQFFKNRIYQHDLQIMNKYLDGKGKKRYIIPAISRCLMQNPGITVKMIISLLKQKVW